MWGLTGLFLAMPIMAGIKAILYHVPEWRPWANLMSSTEDHPHHPPHAGPPAASDSLNGRIGESHADGRFTAETPPRQGEPDADFSK